MDEVVMMKPITVFANLKNQFKAVSTHLCVHMYMYVYTNLLETNTTVW